MAFTKKNVLNIKQSNMKKSNLKQSNMKQPNMKQSNMKKSNMKQSNMKKSKNKIPEEKRESVALYRIFFPYSLDNFQNGYSCWYGFYN